MKKAEMQEMYNEMLRSGNWNYSVCETLCNEAGVGDLWKKVEADGVEDLMEFATWKLGLTETPMKNVKLTVTLTEQEEKTLSCLNEDLDLSDLAQLLLVKLAHGEISLNGLRGAVHEDLKNQTVSFVEWLKAEGYYEDALVSDGGALEMMHCEYLDSVERMALNYEDAIRELENANK